MGKDDDDDDMQPMIELPSGRRVRYVEVPMVDVVRMEQIEAEVE
jgi:hypothetical protein